MILKIGQKVSPDNVTWLYWDKVDHVSCKRGFIRVDGEEVQTVLSRDDNVGPICDRHLFSHAIVDSKGTPCHGNQIRILTVDSKAKTDAEVIATDYTNNVFLCNDEGKTIDRL